MTMLKRKRPNNYGTEDFAATLAEREAMLGLSVVTAPDVADATPADEPAPATTPATQDGVERDAWGNHITSPRGWFGQYTIASWRADQRTVYVCGQPAQHIQQGMWRLDGRMEMGQGYVCAACFTLEAGRYGVDDEREQRGGRR